MSINKTLDERGTRYGKYCDNVYYRARIMELIIEHNNHAGIEEITPEMLIAIEDVVAKLVRVSASPSYKDSWHDIAGYATLVENELL